MKLLCQQKHSRNAFVDLTCIRIKFVFSRQLLPKLNKLHCVNGSVSAVFCMKYSGIYKGSWIINFKGKLASSKADLGGSYIYILRREVSLTFESCIRFSQSLCLVHAHLSAPGYAFQPASLHLSYFCFLVFQSYSEYAWLESGDLALTPFSRA